MKHRLKLFYIVPLLILVVFLLASCSKEDNDLKGYVGENKIVLLANTTNYMQDNSTDELLVNVYLVNSVTETVTLDFALDNNIVDQQALTILEQSTITFKPGEKKGQLKIKSKSRGLLDKEHTININLVKNSSALPLEKAFVISLLPIRRAEALTDHQIELLDGYKRRGLDLYLLMGDIPVVANVKFPGGGNLETMFYAKDIVLNGYTSITLSDLSTADRPILRMVSNPMGIESYLYELFRSETVDDKDFWTQTPSVQQIMELINLSPTSKETFEVELDEIAIDLKTRKITYLSTLKDIINDEYTAVPFTYKYTAWDRLKKLIDEQSPLAVENYEMGGSVYPGHYINNGDITTDGFTKDGMGYWREPTAILSDNTLKFQFTISHTNADDYVLFNIEYKLK